MECCCWFLTSRCLSCTLFTAYSQKVIWELTCSDAVPGTNSGAVTSEQEEGCRVRPGTHSSDSVDMGRSEVVLGSDR